MDKQEKKYLNIMYNIFTFIFFAFTACILMVVSGWSVEDIQAFGVLLAVIFPKNIKFIE